MMLAGDLFGDEFDEFTTQAWQREPVWREVTRDPLPDFDLDAVEDLVTCGMSPRKIRLVRSSDGEIEQRECPTWGGDDRVDPLALFRLYAEGWTIVANGVDRIRGQLSSLAAAFTDMLDLHVNINLYVTPPGAQGFLPHIDGHDVIILPIAGVKSWEIYDCPIELPLEGQPTPPLQADTPSTIVKLTRGRMLYLPRGWRHRTWSYEGVCAHLTVGLHPIRAVELATMLIRRLAERDVRLRRIVGEQQALDFGRDDVAEIAQLLADVPDQTLDSVITDVRHSVQERLLRENGFAPGGTLSAIDQLDRITAEVHLAHRPGLQYNVIAHDDHAVLMAGNTSITMPAWLRPALEFITSTPRFTAADLPVDLTESSAVVLVRRLVREGVLTANLSTQKGH